MKIAILAPEFLPVWGGAGAYTINLVKELSKDDSFEIHVITPKRGKNYDKTDVLRAFKNKIIIHNISNANDGFFYNLGFQVAVYREFEKLQNQHHFDLIHSTGLVHMPDIFLNLKIPSVVTAHTTIDTQFDYKLTKDFFKLAEPVEYLSKLAYPYIKLMQNRYIRKRENYICVSKYVSRFIPKTKNKIIIHNSIDTEKFIPKKSKNKIPKILFCGRLLYMKGIDTLIQAANEVLKTHEAHFVFAGSGNIKKWENRLNIPKENYTFLGYMDNESINSLYQETDIFVLPSFIESFPLTLLEAMSTGLPVIATDVGGISELIENKKNGLLIHSNNPIELSAKIRGLLDNQDLRKKLGMNAREHVLKNHSIKSMAEKTKEFYRSI